MKESLEGNPIKTLKQKISLDKDISLKLWLLINTILSQSLNIKNDPLINLLNKYEEIEIILKLKIQNIINYCYFSKNKLHKILYENQENINIEFDDGKKTIAYNFYLNLLINADKNITNYTYSLNYIKQTNTREINGKLESIFFAKFIIDLINNYKQLEEYEEEKEKSILNYIKKEKEEIIGNNINVLNGFFVFKINTIKDFITTKIDKIYSNIINWLIINEKLQDYEYTYNIINQLDLENIDITPTIFEGLENILNEKKEYIKKYKIEKKEDLYDEKKINFYYILFKYILKKPIFIYQIPFLLNIRANILSIIKYHNIIYDNMKEKKKDKLQFLFRTMEVSEYYFQIKTLKEIQKYFKEFLI